MNKTGVLTERNQLKIEIKKLSQEYDSLVKAEEDGPIHLHQEERLFNIINSIAMRYAKEGFL